LPLTIDFQPLTALLADSPFNLRPDPIPSGVQPPAFSLQDSVLRTED
jgi:hypothetical protein